MEDEFIDLSAFQISPEDQAKIAAIQRDEAAKRKGAIRRRRQDDLFVQITHQDAIAGFAALDCPFALVWCALLCGRRNAAPSGCQPPCCDPGASTAGPGDERSLAWKRQGWSRLSAVRGGRPG
jgi:hypothetical protein